MRIRREFHSYDDGRDSLYSSLWATLLKSSQLPPDDLQIASHVRRIAAQSGNHMLCEMVWVAEETGVAGAF